MNLFGLSKTCIHTLRLKLSFLECSAHNVMMTTYLVYWFGIIATASACATADTVTISTATTTATPIRMLLGETVKTTPSIAGTTDKLLQDGQLWKRLHLLVENKIGKGNDKVGKVVKRRQAIVATY